jgi:hypothetical protein
LVAGLVHTDKVWVAYQLEDLIGDSTAGRRNPSRHTGTLRRVERAYLDGEEFLPGLELGIGNHFVEVLFLGV